MSNLKLATALMVISWAEDDQDLGGFQALMTLMIAPQIHHDASAVAAPAANPICHVSGHLSHSRNGSENSTPDRIENTERVQNSESVLGG